MIRLSTTAEAVDRRFLPILLGLLLFGLAGSSGSADAQDASPPIAGVSANDRTNPAASQRTVPTAAQRTIFKQDENGQWHPVPLNEAAFDQLAPGAAPRATTEPKIPDYFLSRLQLAGTAAADSVTITADVTVEIVADDRWLRVPLRFDQALLLEMEHEGDGQAAIDPVRSANQGISWLLRGRGEHRLRLSLRVPLRKTPEGDQLQLQLPPLEYFTGTLELRIPSNSVTIREGETLRLRGTKTVDKETVISADLRGDRLDLRWTVIEQPLEPIIQQPTEVTLRLLENMAELLVHQRIQFRSGQRNFVRVRLPSSGFELSPEGVHLRDGSGNGQWVQPLPEETSWVRIPLPGVVGNVIELDWHLTQRLSEAGERIAIDGFEVADARSHTGTILVQDRHGYRVSRIDDGDVWITRIDVDQRPASLAYEFSGGQYHLQLDVEPVTPSFSVTPYYFLMVYQDRVILEAAFQINVDEGQIRNVPIRWRQNPGMTWTVSASSLNSGELRAVTSNAAAEPSYERQWTMQLPQLVDRSTLVGLSGAYFSLEEFQETVSCSLPTVVGARAFPGWVVVSTDDNVDVTTRPQGGTRLTLQADSALHGRPIPFPDWTDTQPKTIYRLTTANADTDPQLEHEITVRAQKTKTSAVVELKSLESQVRISQRIAYNVAFGRLARIRLQIPPRLAESIQEKFSDQSLRFLLDGETPLEANWSGRNVVIDLPTPRLGDFEIVVEDYLLGGENASEGGRVIIPIIGSRDQPYDTVRLSVPDQDTVAVTVPDSQWTRLTTVADGRQWITDHIVDEVPLIVDRSFEKSPLRLTIEGALLQTEIDEAGTRATTATY
jgi:hypothetical protein